MHYGGDYNPEQWPEDIWPEDVRLMQEAQVNLVSLGIFAWSRIQPAEGEFDWTWLDRILALLHDGGIQVDLATATASPPHWAVQRYPEILPRTVDGTVLGPGSRQHYAPSSPVYRRLAAELVTALAARYRDHPAVVMWHVNNELGCHLHADYSDNAAVAFRAWVKRKYGDLATLNAAWGTAFWSQIYTDFDQVLPPRLAPYSINPGLALDFKRFTSDSMLELFILERDIIRASGATQPITTNFMGAFAPADYWRWAPEVDVVSDDNYPDPNDPESFRRSAFARDLMRSLKPGTPWLLMEQSTGALNWRPTNAPKHPGEMAATSIQAIGHGADAVMFFQWRQSRRGSEKFHSAMVPQSGTDTRVWREVCALGATVDALPPMAPESGARVAIIFDWENWWALSHTDHPVVIDYAEIVQRWYAALHSLHVSIDIVHPTSELSSYALLLVPQLYLLTDEGAHNVTRYGRNGGTVFVSAFTDVVDEYDAFRPGGFLVGLRELLGVTVEDFGALVPPGTDGPGQALSTVDAPFGRVRGEFFAEELRVLDAEVIGTFDDGRLDGRPALTRKDHGAGAAYYLATVPDDDGMHAALAWLLESCGVEPELHGLPSIVEVARRGDVLTVINHGAEPQPVQIDRVDILTGTRIGATVLEPYGWRMVRR